MKILNSLDLDENSVSRPAWRIRTVSANYTVNVAEDEFIFCNTSSSSFSVTLPSAVGIPGVGYTIKKVNESANNVNVLPVLSQTIDGETSQVIRKKNALKIISDGTNWFIV